MGELSRPTPLRVDHITRNFSSGNEGLDQWLDKIALQAGYSNTSRTFVVCDPDATNQVIAFYSIASASLATADALNRISAGTGSQPIPAVLLARLAVDSKWQKKGIGRLLVKDAVLRIKRLQEDLGIRVILIHAIDDEAVNFYQHLGFRSTSFNPKLLMALLKDIKVSK